MAKLFLILGALSGFITVALGAIGAHYLENKLTLSLTETFKTGVQYQAIHSLALLACGIFIITAVRHNSLLFWSAWMFILGIFLFSGSLYLLSITQVKLFGAVTPVGGICCLAGWGLLAWGVFRAF